MMVTGAAAVALLSSLCVAATVTTAGNGSEAGAVYEPALDIVPVDDSPPGMPLTSQRTRVVGTPSSVAVNSRVAPSGIVRPAGEIAMRPSTRKATADVAVPSGVVTLMRPVVAPGGTVTISRFRAAEATVAAAPLNATTFCAAASWKPRPKMRTVVPVAPAPGVKSEIATGPAGGSKRSIRTRLPTASYV